MKLEPKPEGKPTPTISDFMPPLTLDEAVALLESKFKEVIEGRQGATDNDGRVYVTFNFGFMGTARQGEHLLILSWLVACLSEAMESTCTRLSWRLRPELKREGDAGWSIYSRQVMS